MNDYKFWDELTTIYSAVANYQQKAIEFNKRFINPWIRLGNIFEEQNRSAEAIDAYQKAIELDPKNAQIQNELGNAYFNSGMYEQAIAAYKKAMELDPELGQPCSNLASAYICQGRYQEAIPLYQRSVRLLESDEEKAFAWNKLGNTFRRVGDYDNAVSAYHRADELDPASADQRNPVGGIGNSLSSHDDLVAEETEKEIPPAVLKVNEPELEGVEFKDVQVKDQEIAGGQEELVASETETVKTVPDSPLPLETSLSVDTRLDEAPAPVGDLASVQEELVPAEVEAVPTEQIFDESALKVESENVPAVTQSNESSLDAPIFEQANAAPALALEADEPAPEIISEIVLEMVPQAVSDQDEVAADETVTVEEVPAAGGRTDEPDSTVADDGTSLIGSGGAFDPTNARVWNELGNIYTNLGVNEHAVEAFRRAIDLDPEFGQPYLRLASLYQGQGRHAEAIPLYQRCIELLENDREKAVSWNKLGNAFRRLGDYDKAIAAFQMAVELDPGTLRFKVALDEAEEAASGQEKAVAWEAITPEVIPMAEPMAIEPILESEPGETSPATMDLASALEDSTGEQVEGNPAEESIVTEPAPEADHEENLPSVPAMVSTPDLLVAQPVEGMPELEKAVEEPALEAKQEDVAATGEDANESAGSIPGEVETTHPVMAVEEPAFVIPTAEDMPDESRGVITSKNAEIWYELGKLYFNKGAYDQAGYAFSKSIELNPRSGQPYTNLASTYVCQGRYEDAIPLYQRSIELLEGDREKAVSWNKLGNTYRRLGDYDNAVSAYQMADELDPGGSTLPSRARLNLMSASYLK